MRIYRSDKSSRARDLAARWGIYGLVAIPTLSDLAETGTLPLAVRPLAANLVLTVIVFLLAHAVRRNQDAMTQRAATDPLTGLWNRRQLADDLDREVARAKRQKTQLALAIIDVDHFKRINDRHGHDHGDAVLRSVAEHCQRSVRHDVDRCYRIGGDEFAVLMPSPDNGRRRRSEEQLRSRLGSAIDGVSVSVGVAHVGPGTDAAALLKQADALMYSDKWSRRTGPLRAV